MSSSRLFSRSSLHKLPLNALPSRKEKHYCFYCILCTLVHSLHRYCVWLCRVCDPLIGTGTASGLCPEFCDSLHQACREEFFHYPVHGEFGPCSAEKQPSVVCAKLKEFATNGTQFCAMLGLLADKQGKCFDGTASMLASCSQVRRSMRRSSKVGHSLLKHFCHA